METIMNEITLSAYAKINLSLDVTGKRENGYHDVRMIMQSIALCDTLTIRKNPKGQGITIHSNLPELSNPQKNLAVQAAKLLCEEYHITDGLSIDLEKRIPVAAGMAGGSTDGAAALRAINTLFSLGLNLKQLMEYGVRLGADIPYCLLSGTALAEGIGEILTPLPAAPFCYILLVNPSIHVSTKYVYTHLDAQENLSHPDVDGMRTAIETGNYAGIISRLENILEAVTIPKAPVIAQIKEQMLAHGADGALMSGSGSTVFGLYRDKVICQETAKWFLSLAQAQQEHWKILTTCIQERKERISG